jgi:hypothetical protein
VRISAIAGAEGLNVSETVVFDVFLTDQFDCRNCGECDECQRFCLNCGGEFASRGCTCTDVYDWICPVCGNFWNLCVNFGYCHCPVNGGVWDSCNDDCCLIYCVNCGVNFSEDDCFCNRENDWHCPVCGKRWDECGDDGYCICPESGNAWDVCEGSGCCQLYCINCGGEFAEGECVCINSDYWFCPVCGKLWEDCEMGGLCVCPASHILWYDCFEDCCLLYCVNCGGEFAKDGCDCADDIQWGLLTEIGDVNGDGEVNLYDLTVLREYFATPPSLRPTPPSGADINGDGVVNLFDLTVFRQWFATPPSQRPTLPWDGATG